MNFQTIAISVLSISIIIIAFLIILVGTIGILRVVVFNTFEFDFVRWFENKKTKKPEETRSEEEHFEDLPLIYRIHLKENQDEQNNTES